MAYISAYTFNTNEDVQRHQHQHAHIIIVLEKTFMISFLGQKHILTENIIGFVPPDVVHDFSCSGRALTLNIPAEMIKAADLFFLTENSTMQVDGRLAPLVELIKSEVLSEDANKESLRYLFYYLYDKFVDRYQLPSVRYMNEHYASPISISELAALENYNVSYYTDWFKARTGYMPSEYLKRLRMVKAKEILSSTRYRIIDVAMQVGYTNSSAFTRTFKTVTGMTPHEYRHEAAMNKQ